MKKTLSQNLKSLIIKAGTPIMVVILDDESPANYVAHSVVTYQNDFDLKGMKRLDGRFAAKKLVDAGHRVYSIKSKTGWVQYAVDGDMTVNPRGPNNAAMKVPSKVGNNTINLDCRGYGYLGKYL